jgi:N-acetylneuraminate epimerase
MFTGVLPTWAEDAKDFAPQPQDTLKSMLKIDWKPGPDLPQGFQDSAGGIVDDFLVTAGGFCQGASGWANVKILDVEKPGRYPRGFLNKAWALNLKSPQAAWQTLPDFPGPPRQGLSGAVVEGKFYCWGGFSYMAPNCHQDGFRLSHENNAWSWKKMPDLPWPVSNPGICSVGSKIYCMGGAEYLEDKDFFSNANHAGTVKRLGARLLVFDTHAVEAGWKELAECPGTPRFAQAVTAVGKTLYVIGGAAGVDNASNKYATVVDNWSYDIDTNVWRRLRDLPVASGNFPPGRLVAFDRYILLIGGAQYNHVLGTNGSLLPTYGKTTKHYPDNVYYSDVFVYDAQTGLFGTATPLPLNNNGATTVVDGDRIHLLGGETGGCEIEGRHFGHHPDLYLTGTIEEIKP